MTILRILATIPLAAVALSAAASALLPLEPGHTQAPSGTAATTATATASPSGTATTNPAATSTTSTPPAIPTSFANAAATRDSLLSIVRTLANAGLDATKPAEGMGVYTAWKAAYPQLIISGSAVTPNGSNVSAYSNLLSSKDLASATNPHVLAFTVRDVSGACAAGAAFGLPVYAEFETITLPNTASCTAQDVLAEVFSFARPVSTTSSTVVPGVPRPPATGNSAGTETSRPLLLLALAGAALAAGGGVAAVARRRS